MATNESGTRRRVKLYLLNEDRQWDDKGTGHVSSSYVEAQKGIALIVISESDGSVLLESKIQPDTAYQKQQETLIVWSEGENVDLALSFQEKAGCEEIWEKICSVQGKDPSVEITQEVVDESEEGEETESETLGAGAVAETRFELPPAELGRLEELLEVVSAAMPHVPKRERLAAALERPGYLQRLLQEIFHQAEDLGDRESLQQIHEILRNIIMLNKDALYKILFADDLIMDVIGVLEYDPARPTRTRHRDFLNQQSQFREVLPLHNSELKAKIHQTYRVQYIQDCILPTPSLFEDNVLSTLTSFIFFNKVEITTAVAEDEKIMSQLFCNLIDDETELPRRRDLALFLKELCTFSQTLQATQRDAFFKTLVSLKALRALTVMFGCDDSAVQGAAVDILSHFIEYSPSMVRDYMLTEANEQPPKEDEDLLINIIIDQLTNDTDPELGGALQLCGLIRLIIDPENMMPSNNAYPRVLLQRTEKTEFLGFFYKRAMNTLTAPLFANTTEDKPTRDDYRTALLLQYLLENIAFCIEHHSYHMKNYVLGKDLVKRVLVLLKSRHSFLVLGALRLFRRVVGMKDEFYNRYLTKNFLFRPILELFRTNGHRYNLLNSALIELFEFIRQEDLRTFITHTVEHHWADMQDITYVQTFKGLKLRYEQIQDRAARSGIALGSGGSGGLALSSMDNSVAEQNWSGRAGLKRSRLVDSGRMARRSSTAKRCRMELEAMVSARSPFSSTFGSSVSSVGGHRYRRDARSLEEEEESWFDAEDEEELETDMDAGLPSVSNLGATDGDDSSPPTSRPELMGTSGFQRFLERSAVVESKQPSSAAGDGQLGQPRILRQPSPISIHLKPTLMSAGAEQDSLSAVGSSNGASLCTDTFMSEEPVTPSTSAAAAAAYPVDVQVVAADATPTADAGAPASSSSSSAEEGGAGPLVDYAEDSDEDDYEADEACDSTSSKSKHAHGHVHSAAPAHAPHIEQETCTSSSSSVDCVESSSDEGPVSKRPRMDVEHAPVCEAESESETVSTSSSSEQTDSAGEAASTASHDAAEEPSSSS